MARTGSARDADRGWIILLSSGGNEQITLSKRPYSISDLINVFSAAGLWIETAIEPQLSEDARRRYPHKQVRMNKYLGILVFKLRPRSGE